MEKLTELSHLFVTVFLAALAGMMVLPAMADVTMFALCPGRDQCSLAIYISGIQQAADKVSEARRTAAFGILMGTFLTAFVCGTLASRLLPLTLSFQIATFISMLAVVYARIFLKEALEVDDLSQPILKTRLDAIQQDGNLSKKAPAFKKILTIGDVISLLKSSATFSQVAVVAFFHSLAGGGQQEASMYYWKARFHFTKNQYADQMLLAGIAGMISQLIFMPLLAPVVSEEKLLSIGLFMGFISMSLYSIAWAIWVPFATTALVAFVVFVPASLRSIVSKQVGPDEQGKAQGCISSINSVAAIISPLIFSPLTALFLSEEAPFHFLGFSMFCAGLAMLIAFFQSIMIKVPSPISTHKYSSDSTEA
ncbi:uncharacterized protein LOC126680855 isoform X2 [Mercurialis annua]|uniref:uncharacterized protein LOC126680855 isoform X2 n=1 Tax=Mercurialis annua TaxID=3986 RepID=UPI0024ACBAF7|nr:uncharacterized protein LOC126680855 isoform X2 [Mercurialis annua]